MSAITDLNDTGAWGCPGWLGVSPEKLEVDDSLWRSTFDQLAEYRSPFGLTRNLVHTIEHFVGLDGVVPGLSFTACHLSLCQYCALKFDGNFNSKITNLHHDL